MFHALKQFIFLENTNDRLKAIKSYAQNANSWHMNLLAWQILSLLPTSKEKTTLAQSLKMTTEPGSEWAIFSYFLQEELGSDSAQECILNLAQTRNHPLATKIQHLIDSKLNEPEFFEAVLTYVERTADERFLDFLENQDLLKNLNSYLNPFINSHLNLKVISEKNKEICYQILEEQDFLKFEFSTYPSAIFYLFFSATFDDIERLKNLRKLLKQPQLTQIFDLCFTSIQPLLRGELSNFFENALFQPDPIFLGIHLLKQDDLEKELTFFIEKNGQQYPKQVTRLVLSIRNKICTKILSEHPLIGIPAIEKNQSSELASIWTEFCPFSNENFANSIQKTQNYHIWLTNSPHLGFSFLNYESLLNPNNPQSHIWQDFFEQNLAENILISKNILFYQIAALQKQNENSNCENKVLQNLTQLLKVIRKKDQSGFDSFIDKIYAVCISMNCSPQFIRGIYNIIPFSCTSWAFIAIALTAPKLDIQTLNYAILRELQSIRNALMTENLEKDEYILDVTTRFQSIIIGADKFRVQVTQPTLSALKEIAFLIQNVLDAFDEENQKQNEFVNLDEQSDWNGNVVVDKPVSRWNAILQVCLNAFLSEEEKKEYEKILFDGLRVSPHVEKRWVVRALVHIDSDDAVKTILYQALNHIDSDFVERTIFELFASHHPRAKQALLRCISKNNISEKTKLAIIAHLTKVATVEILQELKDLIQIRLSEKVERAVHEAILEISKRVETVAELKEKSNTFNSAEIDFVIKSFVPHSQLLSVDSRSALRTAEMIFIQSKDWGKESVDLSPIVNMYCKSVELVLRDTFEPFTDAIMRKGDLPKKLDALGYGKMVQEKMQNFEDFIADLPIINTIPYFSKFKLRKMLRAISLYRAGKRFTLDGPKAFALFLVVAARKICPYALQNIFNLPFSTDEQLFDFVKQVHSLQDSRNRAVHEGLTWEAREEIDNMRTQSYAIIATCLEIGMKLNQNAKVNEGLYP